MDDAFACRAGTQRCGHLSFITSLVAAARLVAHWQNDPLLLAAIEQYPPRLMLPAKQTGRQHWMCWYRRSA
jgi:hypothetical protein